MNADARQTATLTTLLLLLSGPAIAHPAGTEGGFHIGLVHPLGGADHVVAMLLLGIWTAQLSGRAQLALPIGFVVGVIAGSLLAMQGFGLPLVEFGIFGSVVAIGIAAVLGTNISLVAGSVVVALFATFHGYAHAIAMPAGMPAASYVAGFIAATVLLLCAGFSIGHVTRLQTNQIVLRVIALCLIFVGASSALV